MTKETTYKSFVIETYYTSSFGRTTIWWVGMTNLKPKLTYQEIKAIGNNEKKINDLTLELAGIKREVKPRYKKLNIVHVSKNEIPKRIKLSNDTTLTSKEIKQRSKNGSISI